MAFRGCWRAAGGVWFVLSMSLACGDDSGGMNTAKGSEPSAADDDGAGSGSDDRAEVDDGAPSDDSGDGAGSVPGGSESNGGGPDDQGEGADSPSTGSSPGSSVGSPADGSAEPGAVTSDGTRAPVEKVDLLLVIDNSISMGDKQDLFAEAVPNLVDRLVSPVCVGADGSPMAHPASPSEECPAGSAREFAPVSDLHVGAVTTSLGGYGAPYTCQQDDNVAESEQRVDMAHLVGTLERGGGDAQGFLSWTPGSDREAFVSGFVDQVTAAGEYGCGWEASLESWYRFLIEPYPHTKVVRQNCPNTGDTNQLCVGPELDPNGSPLIDQALLEQRSRFLRPDSLLAIVILSDENDCSFLASGQSWRLSSIVNEDYSANPAFRATTACETDVNDPCCASCGAGTLAECPTETDDSGASVGLGCGAGRKYEVVDGSYVGDAVNLRCYQQKRRFGVDFLYPVKRYVNALTQAEICPFAIDLDESDEACDDTGTLPNPLFYDENGQLTRTADLIHVLGILGVPWQDLAQQDDTGAIVSPLTFRVSDASAPDNQRINWEWIVGDREPPGGIPNPRDPLMLETVEPRSGTNPATGEALAGPDAASPTANSINGHEWANPDQSDLQYACTFELAESRACLSVEEDQLQRAQGLVVPNCECTDTGEPEYADPLCQNSAGAYGYTQYHAPAYPSIRQLQVLRELGARASVGSICPKEPHDRSAADFGYLPSIAALLRRFKD